MKITVIIPALNEAANLEAMVRSIGAGHQVIVADGGSVDSTCATAAGLGALVVRSAPGRGAQMDCGALSAQGDALIFLHADTILPEGWAESVREAMEDEMVVAGAFRLRISSGRVSYRVIERMATARFRLFGLLYGDQAIFVRRESFFKAGGFGRLPLMEDVDCVRRLGRIGRLTLLERSVVTSPRRWEERGIIKNTLGNWLTLTLYFMGVPPERLYGFYYGRSRAGS
ncbi:MAG: TIGR04283 family arsenosugar biosynthesis glycosyltransferase [Deltaproteobacteria bacterium]|nr:TIGR04283 family arsenosugar biosynthesis glycosyltransferase [Deltaproteobacteria bacterium]